MCKINLNNELKGIELSFTSKPETATIEAIKAQGFRWHRTKKVWYAKQTADRMTFAETLGTLEKIETATATRAPKAQPEKINLDGLDKLKKNCYGSDFAKVVRQELKNRGVKGVSVRCGRSGWTDSITVTITTTESDYRSIEEIKERVNLEHEFFEALNRGAYYDNEMHYISEIDGATPEELEKALYKWITQKYFKVSHLNTYHMSEKDYPIFTKQAFDRITAIYKISNAWNWDKSDLMSDYFDVGYYLDIDIKQPDNMSIRDTMTDEEKEALKAEREEEARQTELDRIRYEEERRQAQKEEEARKEQEKKNLEEIAQHTTVVDCDPEYITALVGGIGKESSLEELTGTINSISAHYTDAVITRKVYFDTKQAFDAFCDMFLYDFDFLSGKGGTAYNDVRLSDFDTLGKLTEEQRSTIKFYSNNCIAVYDHNGKMSLVIDPQGYNYARYVYTLTDKSEILNASEEIQRQEKESESKTPFYIPEAVENQVQALKVGELATVIYTDSWLSFADKFITGRIISVYSGKYAQYNGYWLELQTASNRPNISKVFIRDNKDILIYSGILSKYPEEITREKETRTATATSYFLKQGGELLKAIHTYYAGLGVLPILDTMPR